MAATPILGMAAWAISLYPFYKATDLDSKYDAESHAYENSLKYPKLDAYM